MELLWHSENKYIRVIKPERLYSRKIECENTGELCTALDVLEAIYGVKPDRIEGQGGGFRFVFDDPAPPEEEG